MWLSTRPLLLTLSNDYTKELSCFYVFYSATNYQDSGSQTNRVQLLLH